ncbi:formin-binding protein 4-like [Plakobranchus ocellatus]|uniref:Formin-binding protein 4-like n=1 Tax=Plakobranchus ocellatus TaxID=259542 RepID=A0AAV3ZZL7_9GAST|nr:formin-binding protein 4-like [Plakobranchus ocellatus]
MSRKRKPVLQLGGSSSKLHKYGYSKEFHAADKKGKSVLPTLVGNYSDSDGEDSATETDEQPIGTSESAADVAEPPADQQPNIDTHGSNHDLQNKSPDIDDELKNFLSEIEAIPMPADGGKDEESKSEQMVADTKASEGNRRLVPNEAVAQPVSDTGNESVEATRSKDEDSVRAKPKSRYSMFVKGESEFVRKPSSQETEAITKKADVTEERGKVDIPEEPTTCWQLVQDEGSQYYYYWNTLTNEVTWEIPSEYTQFLLLHREFTEKLAKLPPHALKAYEEKKAKEAERLAAASVAASETATTDTQAQQQTVMYGPAARVSPTPSATTAESVSPSHRPQRKHKKEKKKKRHKRKYSDSSGDSSDRGSDGETRKAPTYGPQLPASKKTSKALPVTTNAKEGLSSSAANVGPHLLSIVPYLSDADEDESADDEGERKTNSSLVATKMKEEAEAISDVVIKVKTEQEAKHAQFSEDFKASIDIAEVSDDFKATEEKQNLTQVENQSGLQSESKGGISKSRKIAKEVIDMFAEEIVVKQEEKSSLDDMVQTTKNDLKSVPDGKVVEKGGGAEKACVEQSNFKQSSESFPSVTKDSSSTLSETTSPSLSIINTETTLPIASKASSNDMKENSQELEDASKLLNIVGYGSDEEERKVADESELSKHDKLLKKEEKSVPSSKQHAPSSSESNKRKKEKKKHRHDNKERKEIEEDGHAFPNIVGSNLGREIMAKVEETLDKEISDIVIHTVSQNSMSELSSENRSKSASAVKLLDSKKSKHKEAKEKQSRNPDLEKETKHALKNTDNVDSLQNKEGQKCLTEEKIAKPALDQERLAAEKFVNKETNGDVEDDDDIDFEDLDDLDRALEVALEKKKVELAKYEERERMLQNNLTSENQPLAEDPKPVAEDSKPLIFKSELPQAVEEKLKAEVKDAAELALSKLEFLDISTENLSRLQILFIELQTRLHDWNAGGLSTSYFQDQLGVAQGLLEQYEQSAVPQGWACQWDRGNNRYYYRNLTTNRIQWDYPDDDTARASVEDPGGGFSSSRKNDGTGRDHKDTEKRSSSKKAEKNLEKSVEKDGTSEDKESVRRKGGSSSRHRKREERDKDRGSKHEKRRDGSSSSHRHRRKRRRRREHSSSSDSSDDDGGDTSSAAVSKSNITASSSSSSRKHHRHHHKGSKKKRKRRSEQPSRSPSIEVVIGFDDQGESGRENEDNGKSTPSVTVVDVSPSNSSLLSASNLDDDTKTGTAKLVPSQSAESIDGEQLIKNDEIGADVDGVALNEYSDIDGVSLEVEETKVLDAETAESGEAEAQKEEGNDEEADKQPGTEPVNTAVIYKPPQIMVPPQIVAAARQPELYGTAQPAASVSAQAASSVQASASIGSTVMPIQGQSSQHSSEGLSEAGGDEAEKQARKKKKEKKLATGPSLMMKKKHMSSMVQKWQKVKKEVEKEDRAKEMRQAAIRKKIEELK